MWSEGVGAGSERRGGPEDTGGAGAMEGAAEDTGVLSFTGGYGQGHAIALAKTQISARAFHSGNHYISLNFTNLYR